MTPTGADGDAAAQDDGQGTVHVPVLLAETLHALALEPELTVVDGTCGNGGHGRGIIPHIAGGWYVGLDRDNEILDRARSALIGPEPDDSARGGSAAPARARVSLHSVLFSRMSEVLAIEGLRACDRVLLDIGVSSMQIDTPERGFSFQWDGPLDMRMNRAQGQTLGKWLARITEKELADIIYEYGEERHSRRIAKAIVAARDRGGLHRTLELADVIAQAMPRGRGRQRIHPATRTFQALRIALNDELGELERGLVAAEKCLRPGGRLVVITFHSLEDRIVKRFLRENMELPFRKPQTASEQECRDNPRARSAKLRCGIKREQAA